MKVVEAWLDEGLMMFGLVEESFLRRGKQTKRGQGIKARKTQSE